MIAFNLLVSNNRYLIVLSRCQWIAANMLIFLQCTKGCLKNDFLPVQGTHTGDKEIIVPSYLHNKVWNIDEEAS